MKTITMDHPALSECLTVEDLIEQLKLLAIHNHKAKVMFVCDYGNHSHTEQALPVEICEEMDYAEVLVESGFSQSGVALEQLNEDSAEHVKILEDKAKVSAVILRKAYR